MATRWTLILLLSSFTAAFSQCDTEQLCEGCTAKINPGFNFLKAYKIDGQNGTKKSIEYSYVFIKGSSYLINICEGDASPKGIVITLFDGKRNKIATNKIDGKYLSAIVFPCNAAGIYYIEYTFENGAKDCGGSVLAFSRNL